ncbi:MAG: HlyD family secretion protein [Betaproteobacteria bacterium]|nr:HlyD family secretion protein [Betaproteobacteria bacterium]
MQPYLKRYSKMAITAAVLLLALALGQQLWMHYMDSPWTRDGRVRADVVNIAPDVDGLVVDVAVQDNQFVHKGDLLFRIDPERYRNAVAEAQAVVEERQAALVMKQAQSARRARVDDRVVSNEARQDASLGAAGAKASYLAAVALRDQARLNLARTEVRSPVDGWVSNLLVRPGDYSHAGTAELAVIDQHSFWVYGYFEENKIALMNVGDPAQVRLLGSGQTLSAHVESFAHGISDRDNPTGSRLLANVNPSFNWVRLAQRVPVRIRLDAIPKGTPLVAGMTCTVIVHPERATDR